MILNKKPIIKVLCVVMCVVGACMLVPMAVSLIYKEQNAALCFAECAIPMIIAGAIIFKLVPVADNSALRMRDGFFIVAIGWILFCVLGCLPFVISKSIPNFADAFFETASGFSTTGSTILTNVEALPKGMLFWRSFTHLLGGMGVLVLTIAILPMLGIGGQKIMRAETTGPTMDKITFTITGSAKRLYIIYLGLTLLEALLLCLGGMDVFDSLVHSFGTLGTGGLSTHSASIGFFGNFYYEMVIAVFMLMAGINFSLYYYLFTGKPKQMFKDTEFRVYIGIIVVATVSIMAILLVSHYYDSIADAFRYSFFQVSSIITTTGYGTADFDLWPIPCKIILFILMLIGGSAGSTAGGLKVIRIILLAKMIKNRIDKTMHPNAIKPIRLGGKPVPENILSSVKTLVLLYFALVLFGTLFISLEGVGLTTSLSAVIACISNIGPGFDLVGPSMNFAFLSDISKIFLALVMIAGRLELYTIVLLVTPRFWDKDA